MNGPAVLVVEDVPQIRATAVQLFQELGCEVFDAYNGHGALKLELPPATPAASLPIQLGRARGHSIHSPRVLSFHEAGPGQRDDTARLKCGAHGRSPPWLEPES